MMGLEEQGDVYVKIVVL